VVSAACCALALLIKPMVLHVGAPLAVLLLAPMGTASVWGWDHAAARRHDRMESRSDAHTGEVGTRALHRSPRWPWRRALADILLYGAAVGALCALTILLLGPAQVWDNLGAYRGGAGQAAGAVAAENLRLTARIMRQEQIGLFGLAAAGVIIGLWRRPAVTLALVAWASAVLGLFAVYGDLADKHIVYLVPPVALLAALGAGLGVEAIEALRSAFTPRTPTLSQRERVDQTAVLPRSLARGSGPGGGGSVARAGVLAALVGLLGIVAYLLTAPALYRADRYLLLEAPEDAWVRRDGPADVEIAELIAARTPPDGWVLSDNPGAAFDARRKVLPYLVDTSGTRVDAGSLTSALATEQVQRYQPSVIVTWPRRLGKLDDFTRRLPELGYRLEKSYQPGWRVYVRE
jgi:hypothetical protein